MTVMHTSTRKFLENLLDKRGDVMAQTAQFFFTTMDVGGFMYFVMHNDLGQGDCLKEIDDDLNTFVAEDPRRKISDLLKDD